MKKQFILLFGVMLVCLFFAGCLGVVGPDDPTINTHNTYEIMYVRVLPILRPDKPDPTNDLFSIFNPIYGGFNSSGIVQVESDKWTAEAWLKDGGPYYIWLIDQKLVNVNAGETVARVAEDIYMRLKGTNSWIKLTFIELNAYAGQGKWAKFFLIKGIQNPGGE